MRITLIENRPYKFTKKEAPDETVEGFMYMGFSEAGKIVKFSSVDGQHTVYEGETEYNRAKSEDFKLRVKEWDGKLKYSEIV